MTPAQVRQRVVEVAAREDGATDARRYWREVLPASWHGPYPPHWCGAFALWALRVGAGCQWQWEVGTGFLYRLRRVGAVQPGDIAYRDLPYQHHAVVLAVLDDGRVITQEGHSGARPGVCRQFTRPATWWTAYYSIDPLVKAAALAEQGDT